MESVRAFVSIDMESEIRARLGKLQKKLKTANADIRWVKPENMHLTLAFLGNIPVSTLLPLEIALQETLQSQEPFTLTIQGTGVFGRRSRPSVVWAGVQENSALMELQQKVATALGRAEIPFDNKRFRPHLTLGRFKSLNHLDDLFQILEKEKDSRFGTFTVDSVQMIKSELKPGGAEYTVLNKTAL